MPEDVAEAPVPPVKRHGTGLLVRSSERLVGMPGEREGWYVEYEVVDATIGNED